MLNHKPIKNMSEYRISSHKVNGKKVDFFHKVREMNYVEGKGFCFGKEKEEYWFSLSGDDEKHISLTSNSQIHSGIPACSERELMDYFRRARLGKLLESRKLVNYDTDPYGREWENGFYQYEVWDFSNVI